jgi:nucleotide-binding universal stress UspA family protein
MSRVLAAIDTSPCAPTVLRAARALAELTDSSTTALHVRENGSESADQAAHEAGVELHEAAGDPVEAITTAAEAPDIAAIVLGARGVHGGAQPAGHAALALISRVSKPVVVVPPDHRPPRRIARVLVPLEGTEETSNAVAATTALVRSRGVRIHVLHVHPPEAVPAFEDQPHHARGTWEREFAARFIAVPHTAVEIVRRVGTVAQHMGDVASATNADLIVLSWSQDLSGDRAQVIRDALAHSRIPVLLVPVP